MRAASSAVALQALHELSATMVDAVATDRLSQEFVDVLEERMGYELLAVLLSDRPGRPLRPAALSKQGQDARFLEEDREYVDSRTSGRTGLTAWVARTGKTACVADVRSDPRYHGIRDEIRSELCVPLRAGGETIGVLNTETRTTSAYTRLDKQFLETAAAPLALAIQVRRQRVARESKLLTTCSYCKWVRDDEHHWIPPETFMLVRSGTLMSHGVCPVCAERFLRDKLPG